MDKPALIFLCHRIPYPPNKGDKIRSWNLLRVLARDHRVFLACYVDDRQDLEHCSALEEICEECLFAPLTRIALLRRALSGLARGQSISVASYVDRQVTRVLERWLGNERIDRMVVFSGAVMRLPLTAEYRPRRLVIDFVDVDSEKWRAYGESSAGPRGWLYRREARLLAEHERSMSVAADVSVFVSDIEKRLFESEVAAPGSVVRAVGNGVDHHYFAITSGRDTPYGDDQQAVVFTGAMDYLPNVEAVTWFAENVLPRLRQNDPRWCFAIVGRAPARRVRALAERDGCIVSGAVPDVRPWVQHAVAAVAPMRVARGIQNKVLEAMSMSRVVVASAVALEGLDAQPGIHCLLASEPADYVNELDRVAAGTHTLIGSAARKFVVDHFDWSVRLAPFRALLDANAR